MQWTLQSCLRPKQRVMGKQEPVSVSANFTKAINLDRLRASMSVAPRRLLHSLCACWGGTPSSAAGDAVAGADEFDNLQAVKVSATTPAHASERGARSVHGRQGSSSRSRKDVDVDEDPGSSSPKTSWTRSGHTSKSKSRSKLSSEEGVVEAGGGGGGVSRSRPSQRSSKGKAGDVEGSQKMSHTVTKRR